VLPRPESGRDRRSRGRRPSSPDRRANLRADSAPHQATARQSRQPNCGYCPAPAPASKGSTITVLSIPAPAMGSMRGDNCQPANPTAYQILQERPHLQRHRHPRGDLDHICQLNNAGGIVGRWAVTALTRAVACAGSCGSSAGSPGLELGVRSFSRSALVGVGGVDLLLRTRQAPIAAGVRVRRRRRCGTRIADPYGPNERRAACRWSPAPAPC
jgi:hypothetical protein